MENKVTMEYRLLGSTGLKVSAIGYGSWMYPSPNAEETTYETVKKALELGVNFFDNAECYGSGLSETHLGNVFKKLEVKKENIVVSTKVFWGDVGGANMDGLSRKRIIEGCNASLKRLQLDYVDILFAHRYDHETPLEETCRAFDWLIRQGKVFYWGTSEWTPQQIASAIEICEKLNLHKPVAEQPQYNMIHRQKFEVDYGEIFDKYGYGATIFCPLASGALTGKYLKEDAQGRYNYIPDSHKESLHFNEWFGPEKIERTRAIFQEFEEIAKSLGGTIPQLALAWTLRNKNVSSALCGFSRASQVEENIGAVELYRKMTTEIDERIEKLLGNRPDPGMNWKALGKLPFRR